MHLRRWLYSSGMSFFASSLGIPRPSSKLGGMGNTRLGDSKLYTTVVFSTPRAALPGIRRPHSLPGWTRGVCIGCGIRRERGQGGWRETCAWLLYTARTTCHLSPFCQLTYLPAKSCTQQSTLWCQSGLAVLGCVPCLSHVASSSLPLSLPSPPPPPSSALDTAAVDTAGAGAD
ncbi:hypothetical protein LZ31DRAFT_185185 [Colletotrichum somersetense]|nr:hypothetical protein LZ31DRAFT_185185 [Colletotrichum somersetense]